MKRPKKCLILIEWLDSSGCSTNWRNLSELPEPKPSPCRSVGWLAHDGKDWKTIVPHVADADEGSGEQGCGEMCIPTRSILRMHVLPDPTRMPT